MGLKLTGSISCNNSRKNEHLGVSVDDSGNTLSVYFGQELPSDIEVKPGTTLCHNRGGAITLELLPGGDLMIKVWTDGGKNCSQKMHVPVQTVEEEE